MGDQDQLEHAASPWSRYLNSITAVRVAPSGLRVRAEAQTIEPELRGVVEVGDVKHLAPPVDYAAAIGPKTPLVNPLSGAATALMVFADPTGKGLWIENLFLRGSVALSQTYFGISNTNPFPDNNVDYDYYQAGTRDCTARLILGTQAAATNEGLKWYTAASAGGIDPVGLMPGRPLYVPPGWCAWSSVNGILTVSYGAQWREV